MQACTSRAGGVLASASAGCGAARAQLACARRARARVGRDAPFRAAVGRRATAWSARARRSRACAAGAARGEPGALVRARAMGSCTSSAKFCTLLLRASRGGEHRRARQACPEVVLIHLRSARSGAHRPPILGRAAATPVRSIAPAGALGPKLSPEYGCFGAKFSRLRRAEAS